MLGLSVRGIIGEMDIASAVTVHGIPREWTVSYCESKGLLHVRNKDGHFLHFVYEDEKSGKLKWQVTNNLYPRTEPEPSWNELDKRFILDEGTPKE